MAQMIDDVYKFRKEIRLNNIQIHSMEEGNNCLYIGDKNGKIHKYAVFRKQNDFLSENAVRSNQVINNQKIDLIKQMNIGKDLLVISNGNLMYVDGEDLRLKNEIIKGNVSNIYLNESKQHQNEVLVQMRNNKLIVLEFDINTAEFLKEKLSIPALSDTPLTMAFLGNLIFYVSIKPNNNSIQLGTKKEYFQIDLNKKLQPTLVQIGISPYPQIKVTDQDELFIVTTNNNTGVLIGVIQLIVY